MEAMVEEVVALVWSRGGVSKMFAVYIGGWLRFRDVRPSRGSAPKRPSREGGGKGAPIYVDSYAPPLPRSFEKGLFLLGVRIARPQTKTLLHVFLASP